MGVVIPFDRPGTAMEAWEEYQALQREAQANPALMTDEAHLDRRLAAHRRFFRLFRRECEAKGAVALGIASGGAA